VANSEQPHSSDEPRLRVEDIGEATRVGACWRLVYEYCDHVQEFASEGLEDPGRLVRFVRRNFRECLACHLHEATLRKTSIPPATDNAQ
jgi:hypothetical protein